MAQATFLNATPLRIAVSLNSDLDTHKIDTYTVQTDALTLAGWASLIAATPSAGVFGANSSVNTLVIFSEGSPTPQIYEIQSSVNLTLDLYLYILGDTMVGSDQSGSTAQIVITPKPLSLYLDLVARIEMPRF